MQWSFEKACTNLNVEIIPFDENFIKQTQQADIVEGESRIVNPSAKMFNEQQDTSKIGGYHYFTVDGRPLVAIKQSSEIEWQTRAQFHELAHVVLRHSDVWLNISMRLFVEAEIAAEVVSLILMRKLTPKYKDEMARIVTNLRFWKQILSTRPTNDTLALLELPASQIMLSPVEIEAAIEKIKDAGI